MYKVENGQLKELANAHSFINYVTDTDSLYWTNFNPMVDPSNNLYRYDFMTGQTVQVGQAGYTYGITRGRNERRCSSPPLFVLLSSSILKF